MEVKQTKNEEEDRTKAYVLPFIPDGVESLESKDKLGGQIALKIITKLQ